jgi:signal transduction histidine kinase
MKSVYWKMFIIFAGIFLLSFLIMAGFFYFELDEFTYNRKVELLDIITGEIFLNAASIQSDITAVPITYEQLSERNEFGESVRLMAENTNAIIWVVNEDGRMIAVSHVTEYDEEFFVRDFYNKTERYLYDVETFEPYFRSSDNEFNATEAFELMYGGGRERPGLTYIRIYSIRGNAYAAEDSKIGIYVHVPHEEMAAARDEIILAYIVPWLISLGIAAVLTLLFARGFSKPLKEITRATREVAKGNFSARAGKLKRKDEIGELSRTYNQMMDQIENLEISRQGFISDVSHELRTPITSINGFVGGILDGTIPPEKHKHYLSVVKSESARLNRLVNDLLVLTRLTNDERPLEKATFDLNEAVRNVVISMENEINDKNLDITVKFEDVITPVYANRDDIERVLFNLIDNAVKFTPEGNGIYISTKAVKTKIMVSIKDEGCGISPSKLSMIWERFYKEDLSRGMSRGGAGLGLAIVSKIIAAHDEKIDVTSERDEGTEFVFSIQQGL